MQDLVSKRLRTGSALGDAARPTPDTSGPVAVGYTGSTWRPQNARRKGAPSKKRTGARVVLFFIGDCLAFVLLRSIVFLIEHLPQEAALRVSRVCVSVFRTLMRRATKVARRNLMLILPESGDDERERILKASFETLARHLTAFCKAPSLTLDRAKTMFDYSEVYPVFQRARETAPNGVGVLIVTMHFGSFELLVQAHALIDRPLSMLTRPFGSPLLERWWNKRRSIFGNRVVTRDGGFEEVTSRLRAGEDVLMVIDQNVRAHHAVFASFFGHAAATTKAPGLAALRTGAPVFFAAAAEVSPNRYKLLYAALPPIAELPGRPDEKVFHLTELIHREFEKAIREYPESWLWTHRRFKTKPIGQMEDSYGGTKFSEW